MPKILPAEAPAETASEIFRKPLNQGFPISSALRASLLKFDDTAANLPVRRSHEGIDASGRCVPCSLQQCNDAALNLIVTL